MSKLIRVKTEGCAIIPHNTIHKIEIKNGLYWNEEFRRYINTDWCDEFIPQQEDLPYNAPFMCDAQGYAHANDEGSRFTCHSYSWNLFRTLGYFNDGSKTNAFTDEEYQEFEEYSLKNNLDINKYE